MTGHGFIARDAHGWTAREVSLRIGGNEFAAHGEFRDKLDLAWSLDIPQIGDYVHDATGTLRIDGTAHGTRARPQVAGLISVSKLQYGEWRADSLTVAGNIDLMGRAKSIVQVSAERAGFGAMRLSSIELDAHGTSAAHEIELHARPSGRGVAKQFVSRISGAYVNGVWQARVQPVSFADAKGAPPTIQAPPAIVKLSRSQMSADGLCALWQSYRFCGSGAWSEQSGWRFDAHSDRLPISVFKQAFPEASGFQGFWQIDAKLSALHGSPWSGTLGAEVSDASVDYQPIAGALETVQLGTGRVDISATADKVTASMRIVTPATTSIEGSARIDRAANLDLLRSPLHAQLHVFTADANLLPLIFVDLDHSAGELTAQMSVTGSVDAPQIQGQVDLKKGELDLYRYNLSIRDLGLTAHVVDNRLTFDGRARVGEGTLAMNGEFSWPKREPVGKLHLQGDKLLVADLPEYRVVAAPNIDFKIDGKRIDVSGEVTIPSARLEPRDLRGAVQLSNDVHLLGEQPAIPYGGFDVRSEVRVSLGDDVHLNTYGLQGKLLGAVTVQTGATTALGRGELNITDGRYQVYGQKLDITRGRLLFDASPLDNPGLDIQAARKLEDRRVGVNVRGTLRAPRMSLFAEPALPQSQIVSMLLTGKPLADLSSQDVATVGAAQDNLKLQGGSVLASQIGRRLGLEEVDVESTGLNDASLVLGKFLSPRLFVSYGISLTESINTLKLRYSLSEHWRIKAESGQNQSADFEYRIER